MALKSYIVNDFNPDVLVVWAERSTSALKIAWDDHGPPRTDRWGNPTGAIYDAEVTRLLLPGIEPPATAGLEVREDVLQLAASLLGGSDESARP